MSKQRDAQALAQALTTAMRDFGNIPIEMKYSSTAAKAFSLVIMVAQALEREAAIPEEPPGDDDVKTT